MIDDGKENIVVYQSCEFNASLNNYRQGCTFMRSTFAEHYFSGFEVQTTHHLKTLIVRLITYTAGCIR